MAQRPLPLILLKIVKNRICISKVIFILYIIKTMYIGVFFDIKSIFLGFKVLGCNIKAIIEF